MEILCIPLSFHSINSPWLRYFEHKAIFFRCSWCCKGSNAVTNLSFPVSILNCFCNKFIRNSQMKSLMKSYLLHVRCLILTFIHLENDSAKYTSSVTIPVLAPLILAILLLSPAILYPLTKCLHSMLLIPVRKAKTLKKTKTKLSTCDAYREQKFKFLVQTQLFF